MRKIFCDKCKKEISNGNRLIITRYPEQQNMLKFKRMELDLCEKCEEELVTVIEKELI